MNGQPVRWPNERPRILLGGYDTSDSGSARYMHLGPFAFSVDREWDGSWCFRFGRYFGNPHWSLRWRFHA